MNTKHYRQSIAILACVVLLVLPILSSTYIALNRRHACTGMKHCSICTELHMAEQIIHNLKQLILTAAASMFVVCVFVRTNILKRQIHLRCETLITLKVELLN